MNLRSGICNKVIGKGGRPYEVKGSEGIKSALESCLLITQVFLISVVYRVSMVCLVDLIYLVSLVSTVNLVASVYLVDLVITIEAKQTK
jgi:hypothetical protein